tara:strand:- start:25 stop:981 length:957 start_codon:yes stop_codon:yes gene_type:complete
MTVSTTPTDTAAKLTGTAAENAELHARIADIMREHQESEAAELAEADAIAEAEAAIAREQQRIKDTQDKIAAARIERDQLAREMARIESQVFPDPVTLEVAQQCAHDILHAFDVYRGNVPSEPARWSNERPKPTPSLNERVRTYWESHDHVKNRLMTPEVSDDAIELTLAVESIIEGGDRFQEDRSSRASDEGGAHVHGLGNAPPECRHTQSLERELRAYIAGDPPPKTETLGSLVLQGVQFDQLAKMVGLTRPNGQPCLNTFALLLDTHDQHSDSYRFIRWHGAYSVATAWKHRQSQLAHRRATNRPHADVVSHGRR